MKILYLIMSSDVLCFFLSHESNFSQKSLYYILIVSFIHKAVKYTVVTLLVHICRKNSIHNYKQLHDIKGGSLLSVEDVGEIQSILL